MIHPENLGNAQFKHVYGLRYAYLAGAMYKAIASIDLVVKLGKSNLMGYFGTGGLRLDKIEAAIDAIQNQLSSTQPYGMNLLCNLIKPDLEDETVALFLKKGIRNVEAAAYLQLTPSVVWFRLKGAKRIDNKIDVPHRILAKVSRPEVATAFMSPAPREMIQQLLQQGKISAAEADCSQHIPIAHDICVESDSGGHTDQATALALIPAMQCLRHELQLKYAYTEAIYLGAAGGLGTPEALAAAFIMGADFVMTGSINQCSVEAGTSDAVKDILQGINIQDTTYAPAGDMFELGARVQVVRKGVLFPARANRLYELYKQHAGLDEIDEKITTQIQEKYFKKSFELVWAETKAYYLTEKPDEIEKAERQPRHKMALIFRWYFVHTTRLAMRGEASVLDYQIHCGPALGAFNQSVKGTPLEDWRNRHVDEMAEKLMQETAQLLTQRYQQMGAR